MGSDSRGLERAPGASGDDTAGIDAAVIDPDVVMRQAGHENFPVAMGILRPDHRRHLLAVYGFARLVDDIGDEAEGDRVAQLDAFEGDLRRVFTGTPELEVLRRLQPSVRELDLPIEPFLGLIEANRQDQVVRRYATYEDLAAYCALSANPVGRLVLHVFGRATEERIARSDEICTALQIVEHLQDVVEDLERDRIYLPKQDMDRFGVTEADLAAPAAAPAVRRLIAYETHRATQLLRSGAPLARTLRGREYLAIAGFVAGGRAAVAAIKDAGFDVLAHRAKPGKATLLRELSGVLVRKR
ncbi:squalene synthase HpnC [Streptomyces scabrisporus]|uniref:squalene synthase HpnC n=1 Tax=Embleya scabrispora TaxID=159449 RepID=UPI00035DD34E